MTKHPLSTLPHEVVVKGLAEIGKISQKEFPNKLAALESLILTADPLLTIAILSTYGLFTDVDSPGHVGSGYKKETLSQSHVELVQALSARIPLDKHSQAVPTPNVIQQFFNLLPELGEAYHLRRFSQLQDEQSDENKNVALIQEELRLHTQVVRNWGYLSKVAGIVKRLCVPIDDVFLTTIGVGATDLVDLFSHLIRRSERLVNDHLNKLRPAFRETTVAGMLDAYHKARAFLVYLLTYPQEAK